MTLESEVKFGERIESGLAKHAVNIETSQAPGVIGLGPITAEIIRAWVEYGGAEVTEVPEGENFEVHVLHQGRNPGFAPTPLDPSWSLSFTAISLDQVLSDSRFARMFHDSWGHVAEGEDATEETLVLGPMPALGITLRVKMWGNQAAEQHYPPPDQWLDP